MSRTKIPPKVQLQLWGLASGRCQYRGCNKPLFEDLLTRRTMNAAYIAHIVADEPGGPRGHPELSMELSKDISNLMLLCDTHHRLVDKHDVTGHPVDVLRGMKLEHEQRLEILTNIQPEYQSHIILYGANIGKHNVSLSYGEAAEAMVRSHGHYPTERQAIEIGLLNSSFSDNHNNFWEVEDQNLTNLFQQKVSHLRLTGRAPRFSVFALAPQPLLIRLGVLLGDFDNVYVYQRRREPSTWYWVDDAPPVAFTLENNGKPGKDIAWVFSLSATITPDRIRAILGDQVPIWTTTHPQPHNDFLRNRSHLASFREHIRRAFNDIKAKHGQDATIHVFPAMPVSACIELGRSWMPKADLPLIIYDQNRNADHGQLSLFKPAITIA